MHFLHFVCVLGVFQCGGFGIQGGGGIPQKLELTLHSSIYFLLLKIR